MVLNRYASHIVQQLSRFAHHDLALVMAGMLFTRLLAIVALGVGGYVVETGPDSVYHLQLGRLAAGGAYPFVDYWVEYPPFFPWLTVLAYSISSSLPVWFNPHFWFNLTLHSLIAPFDIGNVVLIYLLARRLHDRATALKSAWLYAILFVPLFVVLGWFESIALFFVLLALWALLSNRPVLAGIAIGLGVLVKPYVALAGVIGLIHLRPLKRLIPLITAGVFTLLIGLGPFLLSNPIMLKANLDTLLTLPGWSSPYALIDGIIKPIDPQIADRFDAALAASPLMPSRVPWTLVTIGFGLIFLIVLIRSAKHRTPRAAIGLAGLTFTIYLLWSKGYSPQWSLYPIAFLCVAMPDLLGTVLILILEALYVIEWPITFMLLNGDPGYVTALVIIRTIYLVGLAIVFGAMIFNTMESARWIRTRRWIRIGSSAALLSVIALAGAAPVLYAAQRAQAEPLRPAIDLIIRRSTPDRANVLLDRIETYERIAPMLPGWSRLAALQLGGAADTWSRDRIRSFSVEKPEVWYVLDFSVKKNLDERQAVDQRLSETLCKVSSEFAGTALVSRFVNVMPDQDLNVSVEFADGIQLVGGRISGAALHPGDPICLELHWRASHPLTADYTLFVHIIDATGQLIAQSDLPVTEGQAPTSGGTPAQTLVDRRGLVLPTVLAAGPYRLAIGLVLPDSTRLKTTNNTDSVVLAELAVR
jgi:hypothetical protein